MVRNKKILIAGASRMVGSLILKYAIQSKEVCQITCLTRKPLKTQNKKIKQVIISNFNDISKHSDAFSNIDAAYFCIGVYTGNVTNQELKTVTVDYAIAFAETLKANSPKSTLCFLSGMGADRTEKSKVLFAKYKGAAEKTIHLLGINFYAFRPAYIYPVIPRKEPNFAYTLMRFFYPLIRLFGSKYSIKSTELAQTMFNIGLTGYTKEVLENRDILNSLNS